MAKKTKRTSKTSTAKSKKRSTSSSAARADAQFLAKLWGDDEFRASFVSDPVSVLEQFGVTVPEGLNVKVVQDTADTYHIVIPYRPEGVSIKSVAGEKSGAMILTRRPKIESASILTRRPAGTSQRRRGK